MKKVAKKTKEKKVKTVEAPLIDNLPLETNPDLLARRKLKGMI